MRENWVLLFEQKPSFKKDLPQKLRNESHRFHLVTSSPWPILSAFSAGCLAISIALYFHGYTYYGLGLLKYAGFMLICGVFFWWRDVIREATLEGQHTGCVKRGLVLGIILFIVSEVLFFFAFFWSYFYLSFNPMTEIGTVWPPLGVDIIKPYDLPLFNTIILLTSGATVTWAHQAILAEDKYEAVVALFITVFLGAFFLETQLLEYKSASFGFSDSAFGSIFYLMTGFHGGHVFIGTIFLFVCFIRLLAQHFTADHHIGFEAAAWYWHFVDIVWLLLFFIVYIWGIL